MIKKLQALRAKKGFTLVELIVVIAIIGVLAAILVPTMMNVVTKARVSSADSTAKSIFDSVTSWISDLESNRGTVGQGTITLTVPAGGASSLVDGSLTLTADKFKRAGSEANAKALLLDEFKTNYPFKGGEKAIIFVGADRHVKGVVYTDDDGDLTGFGEGNFSSGYSWDSASKEGIKSGKIIGSHPKLLYY